MNRTSAILFLFILSSYACGPTEEVGPDAATIMDASHDAFMTDVSVDGADSATPPACEESVVSLYRGVGQALDGKFDQDSVVLSFVEPRSAPRGNLHLMRVSAAGEVLQDSPAGEADFHSGTFHSTVGASAYSTSLVVHDGQIGLAYHTVLPEGSALYADGAHLGVVLQRFNAGFNPLDDAMILNDAESSDQQVTAKSPQVVFQDGHFVVLWLDYRMNEPRVLGQNFALDGLYYARIALDGSRNTLDAQFMQGSYAPRGPIAVAPNGRDFYWMGRLPSDEAGRYGLLTASLPGASSALAPNQATVTDQTSETAVSTDGNYVSWGTGRHLMVGRLPLGDSPAHMLIRTTSEHLVSDVREGVVSAFMENDQGRIVFRAHRLSAEAPIVRIGTTDEYTFGEDVDGARVLDGRREGRRLEYLVQSWTEDEQRVELHHRCLNETSETLPRRVQFPFTPNEVPGGRTAQMELDLSETGTVGDIKLVLDIAHNETRELHLALAHGGVSVELSLSSAGTGGVHQVWELDDFDGSDGDGVWTLYVRNDASRAASVRGAVLSLISE